MKLLWCWRCKMEIPMLDAEEFAIASKLYAEVFQKMKARIPRDAFKELLDYYNGVTDFGETEPNTIMHHCVDLYGPECENCGKPYRTKEARFCAACGNKRNSMHNV